MSARVLVTGATGFVGRHAVAALVEAGAEVHAVARRPGQPQPGVVWHALDLLARPALPVRPTHVLHAAWFVDHGAFWTAPENLDWTGATLALARAAAEAGATRFVGVGTCVEYDWRDAGPGLRRETDPLAPATLYGAAKAATWSVLSTFAAGQGMSVAWGRLFHLFGPGEDPRRLVASLLQSLRAERPAGLASGRPVRDFLCTVEAGRALAALTLSHVAGPVNVASGDAVAIADLAREIAAIAGRPDLVQLGARPDPAGEPPRMVADVTRLREEVGFSPTLSRRTWLERLWAEG